jgi:predicted MPP superfamily phosphohydrolase
MVNSLKPDFVFFTGDLVNEQAKEIEDYMSIFRGVKADMGVYSILGNHDYGEYHNWPSKAAEQQNFQNLLHAHKELGWNLMLDENKTITVDGESIALIGVENWGDGFIQRGDLAKAKRGTEDIETKILLSRDPSHWEKVVRKEHPDIDLMLAGHTHGMQYGIEIGDFKWSPVQYRYKQWAGLYQQEHQQIYVNRGFGFIGFPGRVGILPEITQLILKRA